MSYLFSGEVIENSREADGSPPIGGFLCALHGPCLCHIQPLKCAPEQGQVLAAQIPWPSQRVGESLISLNKVLKLTRVAFVD